MADAYITGADQLRVMHDALKAAPKQMRAEVVKNLRAAVKPVTKEVQDTVRSAPSEVISVASSGRGRRAAHALNMSKGLSDATARKRAEKRGTTEEAERAAHRAKQAVKAASGAGLRDTIARAVSTSVSTSGPAGVNATWRTRADRMPNRQRKLPKNFNNPKGWRHPVFGNRNVWATQLGRPYFDVVIKKHRDELAEKVSQAVQATADAVAREVH
jgi:hypothetical protein